MKQITQTELIKLIEDKQQNAVNEIQRAFAGMPNYKTKDTLATNKAYYDAYQDLICYIKSVVIVPDGTIVANIPEAEREDLKKLFERAPITPYIEPKVEPLRNDRFKEFETIEKGYSRKILIDATSVVFIRFYDHKEHFEIEIWCNCGYAEEIRFIEEPRARTYYEELVEWWKYWKQN